MFAPTQTEFTERLEAILAQCKEADDAGTVDSAMGELQQWVGGWPPIFDEDGGL